MLPATPARIRLQQGDVGAFEVGPTGRETLGSLRMPGVSRPLVLLVAVGVVAAAVFLALADDTRGAIAAAMIAAGVFLFPTWARSPSFPGRHWVAFALVLGGLAVLGAVLLAILLFVALVVISLVGGMRLARQVRAVELEQVGPDVVMRGAEEALAALEAEGFRRVGGHRMTFGTTVVTSTVLVGPRGDRFASVTDRVCEVASRFGDRWLITINSGLAPLPRDFLRQEVAGGSPSALIHAHESALGLLAELGLRRDRIETDSEVLEADRANDLRAVRSFANPSLRSLLRIEARRRVDEPILGDDERSRNRVEASLVAPTT
jgi:hypothetical protein